MPFEVFLDLGCFVVCCFVDEEDYSLESASFGVCHDVVEVFSELDVSSTREAVPQYPLFRPEEGYEAVHSLGVAGCRDIVCAASLCPAALDFWEEFNPFFVLEC